MKQNYTSILRRTLSAVLLLLLSTLSWAQDYDFESGVILYSINEDAESVTAAGYTQECSGDVVVPSTVAHEGKTYRVTGIGEEAFYGCTSLISIDLPNGLTDIGRGAFGDCTSLTSIDIPEGLTSIESGAFADCSSLTSVDITEGVTSIVSGAFSGCSSLTSVTVSAENPVYDSREGCNAIIETETNTLIAGCSSTVIPSSVTSIGEYAFYDCTSLTSISIPEGVTSIGEYAFHGCTSLTSIDLPEGLTSIGSMAFNDCTSLVTVICRAEAVPVCGVYSVFSGCPRAEATLYVPASALEDYKVAAQWKNFGTILPLDDYETGIDAPASSLEGGTVAAPYYTLDGRRIASPVSGGVYVRGGRKVIVR